MISYAGITLSRVIHALYHGAKQCPEGTPARTIEEIEGGDEYVDLDVVDHDLYRGSGRLAWSFDGKSLPIDYYRGRSIKVTIDWINGCFDEQYYDLDNGHGAAARAIDALRQDARHG